MSLNNSQYDTLMRAYNARQFHNQHLQNERIREVYARSPRLEEIDHEISSSSVACARRLLELEDDVLLQTGAGSPEQDSAPIQKDHPLLQEQRQTIAALQQEKQSILQELGYPADYLDPVYTCPECKDTGFIGGKRCHCFVQASIDLIYTQSNIKNILERENFSQFSFDYYSREQTNPSTGLTAYETAQKAVADCRSFLAEFDHGFENLFFYGETGVGKTFLSNCVAKELLDSGHSVIYFTAFQLFEIFEKSTFQKDAQASASQQTIFDCDLLIIDDLGTELANAFTTSQLFLCLNERMLRRKSTLISTNLNMDELAAVYSERTCSRIFSNYTMIKLFGDDIRIKKKLQSSGIH